MGEERDELDGRRAGSDAGRVVILARVGLGRVGRVSPGGALPAGVQRHLPARLLAPVPMPASASLSVRHYFRNSHRLQRESAILATQGPRPPIDSAV
jgi:hypothetical protein